MTTAPPFSRRRIRGTIIVLLGTALALWAVVSGYYIVFHDSLLSNLLSRQTEMQYAYEDRIAELRSALEGASAQTLRDSQIQDGRLRDLAARGDRLEAQASSLAALIDGGRSEYHSRSEPDTARHASLAFDGLARRFAALETRQREIADRLRERTERADLRTEAALAELGLASPTAAAVGGPFVPVSGSSQTPAVAIALLQEALASHRRLVAVAARLPLRLPVEGPLEITSGFGTRRDPFYGRLALHTGVDLREDYGSTVRAVAGGTVTIAGPENGYGTLVEIDHGHGYATRYAHLSALAVAVGQTVMAGATVGRVGTSGRSTGPHLHYEVRIGGEPVDPARYLSLAATMASE